jgi:hypothetical protein
MRIDLTLRFLVTLSLALVAACTSHQNRPSTSIAALRNLIDITLDIKHVQWEVFNTPEDSRGVPGPTDYVTLVAEITPSERGSPNGGVPRTKPICIVPNAARPWMDRRFRPLASACLGGSNEISGGNHCYPMQVKLKKTKQPAAGLICHEREKALLYVTLTDRTEGE